MRLYYTTTINQKSQRLINRSKDLFALIICKVSCDCLRAVLNKTYANRLCCFVFRKRVTFPVQFVFISTTKVVSLCFLEVVEGHKLLVAANFVPVFPSSMSARTENRAVRLYRYFMCFEGKKSKILSLLPYLNSLIK